MKEDGHDNRNRRILVDLDGTLTVGAGRGRFDFAPIATGAEEFLQELHKDFDEVVICTARTDLGAVKNLMREKGLAKYINDYTNQKLPAKLIVEDRSVVHMGDLKETLRKIREFKTHWEEDPSNVGLKFDSSTTQFDLPADAAGAILKMASNVPEDILHEKGREKEPHITLLFGIDGSPIDSLRDGLKGFGPVKARLGNVSHFAVEKKGFDVVKVDVMSDDLMRLRRKVEGLVEFKSDHPTYQPHATIAYVKPGNGKRFDGDRTLLGVSVDFEDLHFSDTAGVKTAIPLR